MYMFAPISTDLDTMLLACNTEDLNHPVHWCDTWQMYFNNFIEKRKVMSLGNTTSTNDYFMMTTKRDCLS